MYFPLSYCISMRDQNLFHKNLRLVPRENEWLTFKDGNITLFHYSLNPSVNDQCKKTDFFFFLNAGIKTRNI